MTTRAAVSALKTPSITSIGFSGAGFLTCYHLGVSDCLLQQGILTQGESSEILSGDGGALSPAASASQILTGVSGGALCAAGVAVGVSPEDGMSSVLHVTKTTSQQGALNALTPGFSLIDQVEDNFSSILKQALGGGMNGDDYDKELLQERLQGSRLRIGFTDRRIFPPFGNNTRAYFYIDTFESVEDIVAACILSSYIPFITGPAQGSLHPENLAVKRSMERIHEMVQLGYVKEGDTGKAVKVSENHDREYYWDGGLVNVFPVVDDSTVIVTPISARFAPNPYISPAVENPTSTPTVKFDERSDVYLNATNIETLRQMTLASDELVLQERFAQGYSDARRFLEDNNLLSVYSSGAGPSPRSKLATQ